MMNKTLDRSPGDPTYIVKAVAAYEFRHISREDRRNGDLSDMKVEMKTVIITRRTP